MAKVAFEAGEFLSGPVGDLLMRAMVDDHEPVRCRIANEVFRECLGNPHPTRYDIGDMVMLYRSSFEDAFRKMIARNDSKEWMDGGVPRREFFLTTGNFASYCSIRVGR